MPSEWSPNSWSGINKVHFLIDEHALGCDHGCRKNPKLENGFTNRGPDGPSFN